MRRRVRVWPDHYLRANGRWVITGLPMGKASFRYTADDNFNERYVCSSDGQELTGSAIRYSMAVLSGKEPNVSVSAFVGPDSLIVKRQTYGFARSDRYVLIKFRKTTWILQSSGVARTALKRDAELVAHFTFDRQFIADSASVDDAWVLLACMAVNAPALVAGPWCAPLNFGNVPGRGVM